MGPTCISAGSKRKSPTMKGKHLRIVLPILAVLLVACTTTTTPSALSETAITGQMPPDFAFYFEYGACWAEIFDGFNNTFTHNMGPYEPAITIPLALTTEQMEAIYQKMVAIDLFGYPETFAVPVPADGNMAIVTPANRYYIRVRNGGVIKTVEWTDNIVEPTTQEAERLRQLFRMIVRMLAEHPDVKRLPVPTVACM